MRSCGIQEKRVEKKTRRHRRDSGRLLESITPFSTDDTAGVGTNVVYAAIQHLGGKTLPRVIEPKNKRRWPLAGVWSLK